MRRDVALPALKLRGERDIKVEIKAGLLGKTGKYQRQKWGKNTSVEIPKNKEAGCRMQILVYDAKLDKAFPRCAVVAASCNSQTRMAQLFPLLQGFSAKEKLDFFLDF